MLANICLLGLLDAALLSVVVTAQDTCPPRPKNPLPQHLRCGSLVVPIDQRSAFATQTGGRADPCTPWKDETCLRPTDVIPVMSLSDCAALCNANKCMTFTYNFSTDTCTPYRRTGPVMGLKKSTDGTRFFNAGCFETPDYGIPPVFRVKISAPPGAPYAISNVFAVERYGPNIDTFAYGNTDDNGAHLFQLVGSGVLHNQQSGKTLYVSNPFTTNLYPGNKLFLQGFPTFPDDRSLACQIDPCSKTFTCTSDYGNRFFADGSDGNNLYFYSSNPDNSTYTEGILTAVPYSV